MTKAMIFGLIVSTLLVSTVYGQIDPTFCDINTIPADPKNLPLPNVGDNTIKYQATIERNDNAKELTEEINEYYDGQANIGIVISDENGLRTYTYCYYRTNELILLSGDRCLVLPLNTSIALSPFSVIVDANGKEHIATPLNVLLTLSGTKFVYTGSLERVRGIPVNQWKTCLYNPQDKMTYRVTLSYSDPEKWIPAIGAYENKVYTVPVETLIEKKGADGKESKETFTITKYKAGLLLEEEDYLTPPGIYCPGRVNTKELPKIPESFSFRAAVVEPIPKTYDIFGTISNIREIYDYNKDLFRIDYNNKGLPVHEVHDFRTGLRYLITLYKYNCSITALGDGVDAASEGLGYRIRNPKEFFDLEGVPVQYVGPRRVNGINTNVWIAPKNLSGVTVLMEWHFQTDQWVSQETFGINTNELVLINIYTKAAILNDKNQTEIVDIVKRYQIYQFDSKRIDEFDFDISACYDQIGSKQILFKLPVDQASQLKANIYGLIRGVEHAVHSVTRVAHHRIANVEPHFDINGNKDDAVYVTFRLLERPKFYGPTVNKTKEDVTLADALTKLKKEVNDGKLQITVQIYNPFGPSNQTFTVTATKNSYVEDDSKLDFMLNGQRSTSSGYSGGAVAGFIIGFLVLGLLVGLAAAFFIVIKRGGTLPGPLNILNPNFKSTA